MKKEFEYNTSTPSFDTSTKSKLVVKIAVLLSTLMFLAIISAGLLNYNKNVDLILKNLQNQLQLAANTIAISIDGDKYEKLKGRESMDTPEYKEIKGVLREFMVNSYLGFETNDIYTFRRVSADSLEFTVMLHDQYVGNRYGIREEMLPTLEKGIPSYTGIYEDENGVWVSAYAPILNSEEEVVGMVEADFKDNVYLMAVRDEIYSILLFSLVGIGVAIIIAILVSRLISRPIVNISQAAVRFSKGDFDVSVPVSTRDEIGMLARAFNHMVNEIKEKEVFRRRNEELAEAYRKLDQLNKSLQEANHLKSEFLSIAAHDLKNPLQVISGFAEMITETPGQNSNVYRNAKKINDATRRMLRIISQLLDTTALESGQLKLNREKVDLEKIARKVANNNKAYARKKNQNLEFFANGNCVFKADRQRMYEIMDNLISNAIKFSPEGNTVTIRIEAKEGKERSNGKLLFSVRDRGQGLTEDDKQKLFGKFMRLSAQPTAGESSTGLGLSVVKQLVELHGGRIWAESPGQGRGSTFFVELG
ncbi:MAG: HAMP domain-containing protein [Calditrichae bacterium]|nr:HAMP domain-containing protein [Calditrichia bacterium]